MSSRHRMPAGRPKDEKEPAEVTEPATTEEPTETAEAAAPEPEAAPEADVATETEVAPEADAEETADAGAVDIDEADAAEKPDREKRKVNWSRVSDYGAVPPAVSDQNPSPALDSMNAARDSTIKMLSYKPETVDQQLNAARDLLTGDFRDSYTSLITDVVIPGAQQKKISAVASVPAVASVSADPKHAVVLVFVNQTVVVGQDMPSDTASSVRVTLDKVDGRWLISEFEPV